MAESDSFDGSHRSIGTVECRLSQLCALWKREPSIPTRRWASSATKWSAAQNAASFRTQGILAPLLVRELEESKYEVVAGARRLRAAKLAELEKLPVRVVKLTDAEAIEAQCVENLQREDIHPLEEALGFKSLLELGEPATPSPPLPHALARVRLTSTVALDSLTSYHRWPRHS